MPDAATAVTALAFRSPASSAGRAPCPAEAASTTTRLLVGTAGGAVVAWPAAAAAAAAEGGLSPPPPPPLPCRRRRPPPAPASLTGHAGPVHALATGPGGLVASGGADRTVRLWPGTAANADGGTILSGHQGAVWGLAMAAGRGDGGTTTTAAAALLLSGSADKTARVWALPAGGPDAGGMRRKGGRPVTPLALTPARTLAGHHTDWVRAVDLAGSGGGGGGGGACCACCGGPSPALPPSHALTGGDDGRAVVWDVEAGAASRVVRVAAAAPGGGRARGRGVRAVRFVGGCGGSNNPLLFATGDAAGWVTLWDGRDGRRQGAVAVTAGGGGGGGCHAGPVAAVVVAAASAILISAGVDGTVRTWDVRGGVLTPVNVADAGLGPLAAAALAPCGRGVVVGGPESGRVEVVDVVGGGGGRECK